MAKKRIFVACSDERLRIAVLLLLDHVPGMAVIGITDRIPNLLSQLWATQPDVLLLEWDLPFNEIEDLLSDIHNLNRRPMIIFISGKPEEEEKLIAAGADYFISKDAPPDMLIPILKQDPTSTVKISNTNP
jgi:DNA-binding NarL/FixJ family response regulator